MDWVAGDSTIVWNHQHVAGQKSNPTVHQKSPDTCLERSCGGLSTKIHGTTDALGNPTELLLSAGERADIRFARDLVGEQRPKFFIADNGYDADYFLEWLKEQSIKPVIPAWKCCKEPREIDMNLYADRNTVERFWNRLKQLD